MLKGRIVMDPPMSGYKVNTLPPLASTPTLYDEELSDKEVYQLLKDAEQRLGSGLKGHSRTSTTDSQSFTSSLQKRLSTGPGKGLALSYIKITNQGAQVDPALLVTAKQRRLTNGARTVDDAVLVKSNLAKNKLATAGADWYNIPRTNLTPELKRDLQLLRMKSVLDPKRHYKNETGKTQIPEFSQVGTIIEGPTEFFNARLTKKDRKRNFVEEVLAGKTATRRFKSKYNDIQKVKISGKKAHYKKLKLKRAQRSSSG